MLQILKHQKQSGFSLIEVLMTAGILTTLVLGIATYVKMTGDAKHILDAGLEYNSLRQNLISTLNSPAAWNETVQKNLSTSLACINHDCFGNPGGPIAVYDETGNIVVDVTPTSGMRMDGSACGTFNAATGDPACVYHFAVTWQPLCPSSPCPNPQILVNVAATYSPSESWLRGHLISDSLQSFSFIRGEGSQNNFQSICQSVGGVYSSATNTCAAPWQTVCPQGTVVVGLDPNTNHLICRAPFAASCPAGQFMRGMQPDGVTPVCKPLLCPAKYKPPTLWIAGPPLPLSFWSGDGGDGGDGGCDGSDGGCS